MNNRKRTALCLLGAALCVFMAFGAALALGRYPITPAALLAGDAMAVRTFTVLRLPRAVMALIGGFGLGVAGFVYQTVFRNPLASPDIIGVSSGASVGAAFAILFVSSGALSTTVCAFAGGLAAVFLSLGLAAAAPGRSKMSLVLAGIAVTLTLGSDGRYTEVNRYCERPGQFTDYGRYTVRGNILTLRPNSPKGIPAYYRVGENRLWRLDSHQQPITGPFADQYILTKSDSATPAGCY